MDAYRYTLVVAAAIVLVGVPVSLLSLRASRPAGPPVVTEERPAVPVG
ncbi:hypothetical protein [Streptosporangium sp. OZ121]